MNIIINHCRKYNFTDPKTNNQIAGIKIQYILNDDLEPITIDGNEKGYQVAEATLSLDKENNIKQIPGVYNALFVTKVNAKNQAIQKLVDVNFLNTVPELYTTKASKAV